MSAVDWRGNDQVSWAIPAGTWAQDRKPCWLTDARALNGPRARCRIKIGGYNSASSFAATNSNARLSSTDGDGTKCLVFECLLCGCIVSLRLTPDGEVAEEIVIPSSRRRAATSACPPNELAPPVVKQKPWLLSAFK